MFYIIFAVIWLSILSVIIYCFYNPVSGSTIMVNGRVLSPEEFSSLLWPKIMYGVVMLIGIAILLYGIHMVIKSYLTDKHGKKAVGLLLSVEPNGQTINDAKAYDAVFLVLEQDGGINVYRRNIGTSYSDYDPNEFYVVLYYKNNINILSHVDENTVPAEVKDALKNALYTDKNPYFHG